MLQKGYKDILALHEMALVFFTLSLPSLCTEVCNFMFVTLVFYSMAFITKVMKLGLY